MALAGKKLKLHHFKNICVPGPMFEVFPGFGGNRGKWTFISGEQRPNFKGNKETKYRGTGRYIRIPYLEFLRRAQKIHYWII